MAKSKYAYGMQTAAQTLHFLPLKAPAWGSLKHPAAFPCNQRNAVKIVKDNKTKSTYSHQGTLLEINTSTNTKDTAINCDIRFVKKIKTETCFDVKN